MKWSRWLEKWDMASLKINLNFLEMEWKPNDADKNAAWELYIELLTRISIQYLAAEYGDEKTALESIYRLFDQAVYAVKNKSSHIVKNLIHILVPRQIAGTEKFLNLYSLLVTQLNFIFLFNRKDRKVNFAENSAPFAVHFSDTEIPNA